MSDNTLKTPLNQSLNRFAEQKAKGAIHDTGRSLPCSVVEVVSSGIVTVKFELTSDPWTLPNIKVPIFGSRYVRFPIQVGDKGCVFAADARLGGVSGLGGGVASLKQPANLTALMFAWCGSTEWEEPDDPDAVMIVGPNGAVIRDDASTSIVTVNADGTKVEGKLGVFGETPVDQQTVSGPLSSVTDPAAMAVLTSIIEALAAYGLAIDGTT